jgi:hypothetical protein
MLASLLLAAAVNAAIMAAPSDVSPAARAVIAPVHEAIERVRAEQAALPPATTSADKLDRMRRLDQAPRLALEHVDFSKIAPAERPKASAAIWQQIIPIDEANERALTAMLPAEGWFTISKYGRPAAQAAFLIVQHAPIEFQEPFLPRLEALAAKGEVDGGDYALLYDRVAVRHDRPQRYGSQMRCEGARWVPNPIEDPPNLDKRRAAMGMGPYADYLARFAHDPPCG